MKDYLGHEVLDLTKLNSVKYLPPEAVKIDYLGDMQSMSLKPDDILVLTLEQVISGSTAERLKEQFAEVFGNRKVLVLHGGMKLGVIASE